MIEWLEIIKGFTFNFHLKQTKFCGFPGDGQNGIKAIGAGGGGQGAKGKQGGN